MALSPGDQRRLAFARTSTPSPYADPRVTPLVVAPPRPPNRPLRGLGDPHLQETLDALHAGFGGALDTASLGLFDPVAAGVDVLRGKGDFRTNLARQQAQDAADAQSHPIARRAGMAGGAVASVLVPGAEGLAAARAIGALGSRAGLAEAGAAARAVATGASIREGRLAQSGLSHLMRVGGVTGAGSAVVGKAGSDLVTGRHASIPEWAGTIAGGGLGGVASPFAGPVAGGALTGAIMPTAEAVAAGRLPSLDDVYAGTLAGAVGGRLGGQIAGRKLGGLNSQAKGKLGERLSEANALLGGEQILARQRRLDLKGSNGRSGFTRVDLSTAGREIEAKLGDHARLSERQRQAINENVLNYVVEHWLPRDIKAFSGVGLGALLPPTHRRDVQ